jgi:Iron-sulfur cluster-binding domain
MPFCYSPWNNIDISPTGAIAPCCKFQRQQYKQKFNIQTHTIKEYKNSDFLQQLKQDFLEEKWPVGCDRCRIEEENSIASKRQLDWTRWQEQYRLYDLGQADFITASLAFGNTCNLTCITCGPHASSRWEKEAQVLFAKSVPHFKFYKNNFINDFTSNAPNVIHLDIPGGEPFLSGVFEQKTLLQHYIDTGQAQYISLHYTTNATVFPDTDWWNIWTYFKEIDIQLSIDGVGAQYEYIRYPADWNQLVENTSQYLDIQTKKHNLKLSVSHTVSAYNIYYLDEFFSWCYNIGLPSPWLGKVYTPVYMKPEVWNDPAKKFIIDKLMRSNIQEVNIWSNLLNTANDNNLFEEFKTKLHLHDQYRNLNFKKIFPELAWYV